MSDVIQLLPDSVANQIAAGEVVQRPASVVKELLENAIDAGADKIQLIVKDAGKTLIQVVDNGVGMSPADALLSFERHATSKIRQAEDLFQLHTKGFRGEALASIAAIAQVDMITKRAEDELGSHLRMEGSELKKEELTTAPEGTSISVKNLFFNIPARRNFLKNNAVETRHIVEEFQRVALAHPQLGFVLHNNGEESYNLKRGSLRQRIVQIFGKRSNEKLVPVEENTDIVAISGFVGKPQYAKKKRGEQFFFVNNRFIRSSYLNHALNSAMEGLLQDGYFLSYFLFLDINPENIDINIHPTKTEIKFEDEQAIYAILRSAVKHAVGQYNIAPSLDFDTDPEISDILGNAQGEIQMPEIRVNPDFNPFRQEVAVANPPQGGAGRTYSPPSFGTPSKSKSWEALFTGLENVGAADEFPVQDGISPRAFDNEEGRSQQDIFAHTNEENGESRVNHYQIHNRYILNHIKTGVLLIDQHRAHHRILFEQYIEQLKGQVAASQQLLFPVHLRLSPVDLLTLKDLESELVAMGFQFDFSNNNAEVIGTPTEVSEGEIQALIEQTLEDCRNELALRDERSEVLANSIARSTAIKRGARLDEREMAELVNQLFACEQPNVTPSGKPIIVRWSLDQLDKHFN